jgi:large subunit ribosomal protein L4
MMKLNIIAQDGKDTANKAELSEDVFNIEPNEHAVWLDVKVIMANKRQGTHATKGRSYVSGGGRKPFKQKGTGRARQGSSRAPHHVGGGRVFGPSPRTYDMKINKKTKSLAKRSVLSDKAKSKKIVVMENFKFDKPSTKSVLSMLDALKLSDSKVLLCTDGLAKNIVKSVSNLYKVEVRESNTFSTYDVLRADTIIFQVGALTKVNEVLGR